MRELEVSLMRAMGAEFPTTSTDELFIWDLPAVQRELGRLGLDWNARAH